MLVRQSARPLGIGATAFAMLFTASLSAIAQITTGSVVGTVKDAQGGVIPGATVTLTAKPRGRRSRPTVTNATGDFQFPVTPVDTYTVEITMPSFKTIKQSGVAVSPGARTVARHPHPGSRRRDRDG